MQNMLVCIERSSLMTLDKNRVKKRNKTVCEKYLGNLHYVYIFIGTNSFKFKIRFEQ